MARKLLFLALTLTILAVVCGAALYRASQQAPEFYAQAVAAPPAVQKQASDEALHRASLLASDVNKTGPWQAAFTEAQINGWLAVDFAQNYPGTLPPEISDPRVQIRRGAVQLACRYRSGSFSTVYSLVLEPYLTQANEVAVRIRSARAGWLPLPLKSILDGVTDTARQAHARLEWRQADGDPVAVFGLPPADKRGRAYHVDSLRLEPGKLAVTGRTTKAN